MGVWFALVLSGEMVMSLGYTIKSSQKTLERRASRVLFAHQEVMVLEVEIVHCFVLNSCDSICVDDDVVIVEEVEGLDNIVQFII